MNLKFKSRISSQAPAKGRKLYERALRMCFEKRPDFGGTVIMVEKTTQRRMERNGWTGQGEQGKRERKKGRKGREKGLRLRPSTAPCASEPWCGVGPSACGRSGRVGSPDSVEGRGPGLGRPRGKLPTCVAGRSSRTEGNGKKDGEKKKRSVEREVVLLKLINSK